MTKRVCADSRRFRSCTGTGPRFGIMSIRYYMGEVGTRVGLTGGLANSPS